ncbi:hypothetical protein [Leucobacter sp. GX24907]
MQAGRIGSNRALAPLGAKGSILDQTAGDVGVVPESIAPQEEMYPFVPGCGSTQLIGMKAA